ncbi:carbohydrate esterase family 16 protein [Mycena albidolilacea]|uniref:Carbohydrate esterase family 16 protein n=1 Tax=Mycena albidolilacea TaxID=1033008 RepID=A0AAD6ZIH2_9AGAR|nr:carbohydrate esterase family 16 protein [Mycena albidolilacea]
MVRTWAPLFAILSFVSAFHLPFERRQTNDGVHLAITPACGKLGGTPINANAGVVTTGIKTLVAFGDSYTFGGKNDGGPLPPAVLIGTNPRAGNRATDGPVWAEDLASDLGATIKDYAISGAVVNVTLWPSKAGASDFLHQAALFLSQNNTLNPVTTLYAVFFGIKSDNFTLYVADGNHLPQAAADLLAQIERLAAAPTNAKNILVVDDYGFGTHSAIGDAWKQAVFTGLITLRAQGLNVAFVDFSPLWDAVLGTTPPGFAAFGYKNPGNCIPNADQTTLAGECATPLQSFYWLPSHPSKETHRIMADYVDFVLANCEA